MKKHFIPIFLILLLGCASFTWIKNLPLAFGDSGFYFSYPERALSFSLYVWNTNVSTGTQAPTQISSVGLFYFLTVLKKIGLSSVVIQKLLFYLLFTGSGLSMYFLSFRLNRCRHASFWAGFFYMFNPYSLRFVWSPIMYLMYFYPFLPLILGLFIGGLKGRKDFSAIVFVGIASLFMAHTFFNPPSWFIVTGVTFFIFLNILNMKEIVYAIKLFIILILLHLWWLVPALMSISGELGKTTLPQYGMDPWLNFYSLSQYPLYLLRLCRIDYLGLHQSVDQFLSFIPPIIIFSVLLLPRRKIYEGVRYFLIIILLGTFLMRGMWHTFEPVYQWFFKKVPILALFRNPFEKWGILGTMGYSLLFGISIDCLWYSYRNYRFKKMLFRLLTVVCIIGWIYHMRPLYSGEVYAGGVEIPKDYVDINKIFARENNISRILSLPVTKYDTVRLNWKTPYYGGEPSSLLFDKPAISRKIGNKIDLLYEKMPVWLSVTDKIGNIAKLMNIKYILAHKDVAEVFDKDLIGKQDGVKLITDSDNLTLYKFEDRYFLPRIYVSLKSYSIKSDNLDILIPLSYSDYFSAKPVFFSGRGGESSVLINKFRKVESSLPVIHIFLREQVNLQEKQFFMPQTGLYSVKAKVKPDSRKKIDKDESGRVIKMDDSELKNWSFEKINTKYTFNNKNGLELRTYFNGNSLEDEYVLMRRKGLSVDLNKYPIFEMEYKVDNVFLQTIEVIIGLDFNGDNAADSVIKCGYPYPASTWRDIFSFNVFEQAKEQYPDKMFYNLVEIELYFHKIWWRDCTDISGWYRFWINKIIFNPLEVSRSEMAANIPLEQDLPLREPAMGGRRLKPAATKNEVFEHHVKGKGRGNMPILNKDILQIDKKSISIEDGSFTADFRTALSKGWHTINDITELSGNFKIEWVLIEPVFEKENIPVIKFECVNPTLYKCVITNARKPFWIVFSETFDKNWCAYIRKKGVKPWQLIGAHYLVNGYANGWWIEPSRNAGEYEIILQYKIQKLVFPSFVISGLTLTVCMGYILCVRHKRGAG